MREVWQEYEYRPGCTYRLVVTRCWATEVIALVAGVLLGWWLL